MTKDNLVAWWSQAGVTMGPKPPQYPDEPPAEDWMEKAGYAKVLTLGDSGCLETDISLDVQAFRNFRSNDHHLIVTIWSIEAELTEFFVNRENSAAFYLMKLPELAAMISAEPLIDNVRRIRKAVVAYARHGQGRRTIDEEGEVSLDQEERSRERRRRREQMAGASGP